MTVDEKLNELLDQVEENASDSSIEKAMRLFAAWCVREAATRASILDYDRDLVEPKLKDFADYLETSGPHHQ